MLTTIMLTTANKKRLQILILACVTAFITGCGGSDGSAPSDKLLAESEANFPSSEGMDNRRGDEHGTPQGVASEFFPNPNGIARVYSTSGPIDTRNPFFKPFGNGRSCASCHAPAEGFSLTPKGLQMRFIKTAGNDPVFRPHDGANAPNLPMQTLQEKRAAYSMLLNKGVIRIGMKIPENAEFELVSADDPYHYASVNELSLFRRPLPSVNMRFNTEIMWDDRERAFDPTSTDCLFGFLCFASLDSNLARQADNATKGHAQAAAGLTQGEQQAIVDFEKNLYFAQVFDNDAKSLTAAHAKGGPIELSTLDFYLGINDFFLGNVRTGGPFDPAVMQVFNEWGKWESTPGNSATIKSRASIARGEKIFNTKTFDMIGVGGINDAFGIPVFKNATCTLCHNAPQVGTNTIPFPGNIGIADASRRTPDMPLYTLRNKSTGEIIQTQDPGAAMTTGLWSDIGKFKATSLRGLAARPPYFHDGSAATVEDVVLFYNARFNIGYTAQEIKDLTAFLSAL